jgi:hypothetical protein
MSQYDDVFNSEEILEESLSPEEAVAAIAVITAIIDSETEDIDTETLAKILWDFKVFDSFSEGEIEETIEYLKELAKDKGLGPLFNTANASLSDDVVLDSFAAGVVLLLDDQDLSIPKQKQVYLKKLQVALEIEDEIAAEIIQDIKVSIQAEEYDQEEEYETISLGDSGQQFYESLLGNFIVPVPVDLQQGGSVHSQKGLVSFSDDLGTLLRIDYYQLTTEYFADIATQGQEKYLQTILLEKYIPQVILANIPGSEIRFISYLADTLNGAYYALIETPKGSTISKQETNGHAIRLDAYRGLIVFIHSDYLYVVSSQRSFFHGQIPDPIPQEAERIKQMILDFVKTIEFS